MRQDMYMEFYEEVCKRTAQLVAGWQCVGFCHGEPASCAQLDGAWYCEMHLSMIFQLATLNHHGSL